MVAWSLTIAYPLWRLKNSACTSGATAKQPTCKSVPP